MHVAIRIPRNPGEGFARQPPDEQFGAIWSDRTRPHPLLLPARPKGHELLGQAPPAPARVDSRDFVVVGPGADGETENEA